MRHMPHYNNIRVEISVEDYRAFKALLVRQDKTISKALGDYMRGYLARHKENNSPLSVDVRDDNAE